MDNAEVGGNRGNFAEGREVFGSFDSFEKAFEGNEGKERREEMGGIATSEMMQEMFDEDNKSGVIEAPAAELGGSQVVEEELKPLAADGTTEGKMGRLAVSLMGDKIDEKSLAELARQVDELSDDPYKLDNFKNRVLSDSVRDSYGRMIGNDDIGEIQAEEQRAKQDGGLK